MSAPVFFETPAAWRRWLETHHASESEIVLGLVKKGSGLTGINYREALDEALCFGWIDGVRNSIDDKRWTIRFTPRQRRSNWSDVNLRRVEELKLEGRMASPGLEVLGKRDPGKTSSYSYDNRSAAFDAEEEAELRANAEAWRWLEAAAPSYRRAATWWVVSAKRVDTRARRLQQLIDDAAAGRRVKSLRRPNGGEES